MAVTPPTEGFFSTSGTLLTPTRVAPSTSTPSTSSASVTDTTAAATASAITDAAVVSISNRLNVGDTGFNKGVSEIVGKAVNSALQNQALSGSSGTSPQIRSIGGTFQNDLIAKAKEAASKASSTPPPTPVIATEVPTPETELPTTPEVATPETTVDPENPITPRRGRRGQGRREERNNSGRTRRRDR